MKFIAALLESEGFIVPIENDRQHNDIRGKGPCFVHAIRIANGTDDCIMLGTSKDSKESVRQLQRKPFFRLALTAVAVKSLSPSFPHGPLAGLFTILKASD